MGTNLISTYAVTPASVHDSQALDDLINEWDGGQPLYGDSAFIGQEASIDKCKMVDQIHEKGTRAQKLTEKQKESNRRKSSIRCRIEYVFSFMTNTMKTMYIKTIGIKRAEAKIGLGEPDLQNDTLSATRKANPHRFPAISTSSITEIIGF